MSFDPDAHDTQDVLQTATASRRPRSRVNKSILTAIFVFSALTIWLMSGVMSDNAEPIEPAEALITSTTQSKRFKVLVETLDAEAHSNMIKLQARTEADKIVTVAAETMGTIAALPVPKGAFVQEGQIICAIDVGARKAQLDQARATRDARKIEFTAAKQLQEKGHTSKSQLAAARAAYDSAIAGVTAALVEYERTKIKAPFGGILDKQPVEVGNFLSVGQSCGTIIDKDPLLVVAHIAENQVSQVAIGNTGTATLATGETVSGKVRYVAETPNPATRTFRLEMEVANRDLLLRDGISAELILRAGEVAATRIPQSVLTLGDSGRLGVRVVDNGRVAFRPVTVISDDRDGAYVVGLAAREQVIVSGGEFTRDGRIVDFETVNHSARPSDDDL
jgi:multidrug efflux system membrane fusion protein